MVAWKNLLVKLYFLAIVKSQRKQVPMACNTINSNDPSETTKSRSKRNLIQSQKIRVLMWIPVFKSSGEITKESINP